jgi:hypothetical protein
VTTSRVTPQELGRLGQKCRGAKEACWRICARTMANTTKIKALRKL